MPHVPSVRTAVGEALARWAVESQHAARRNAMVASTAMAARRREQHDVQHFLDQRYPDPAGPAPGEEVRGAL